MPEKRKLPERVPATVRERLTAAVGELGAGECYLLREAAEEWGITPEAVRRVAAAMGVLRVDRGGSGSRSYIVNPDAEETKAR